MRKETRKLARRILMLIVEARLGRRTSPGQTPDAIVVEMRNAGQRYEPIN